MIEMKNSFFGTAKATDHAVASLCLLGALDRGTGLSGVRGMRPESSLPFAGFVIRERIERPTTALEAGEVQAQAYALTATGAGTRMQATQQHHLMWAFRGPQPWSDPA
ncbi:hypothetical protein GCM10018787_11950 [Streptomyces thermodiastaticus]|nr:hypothetical protein GCM10018787_11950 [Streptomyces thermodiastaticus]